MTSGIKTSGCGLPALDRGAQGEAGPDLACQPSVGVGAFYHDAVGKNQAFPDPAAVEVLVSNKLNGMVFFEDSRTIC
jgi:hypothetical protein